MFAQATELVTEVEAPDKLAPANILIADDLEGNILALEAVLQPLKQNIVRASSGIDVLRKLLRQDFAVILLDVQMPGMDGFETANLIKSREKCKYIPIIFISAVSTQPKYVFQGYSSGAVDYISKPFHPEILRSKVSVFIDLYNKQRAIQRQSELLNESVRREAVLRLAEFEKELERKQLRELAETLEASVNERTRELQETNRDLESFCYSIAHDLRTPIREVAATSNILLADCAEKLGEEDVRNLRQQIAAARNMSRIIEDLLRLSRLGRQAINRSNVDISSLAQTVFNKVSTPRVRFEIETPDGLKIEGDHGLVEILLQNLADNAVKYSPDGGLVRFGSKEHDGTKAFFLKDEGIGFDMCYERKIFLPFERLVSDASFPGTGVGLALVHKIVTKHGGKVWAESEIGKGSTFFFTLNGDSPYDP